MKKFKFKHPTEKVLIFIIVMLIGLIVAIMWFYGDRINILWQQSTNNIDTKPNNDLALSTDLRFYIQSAVKSLYNSQPVTDPLQQRVYFPEAKFYVPYSDYARTIVYRFTDADSGTPAIGSFTSSFNTNILPTTFNDVPCVQRHVSVLVDSKNSSFADGTFVSSVKLDDGRALNFYKDDNKSCNNSRWDQGSTDKLVSVLEEAKSY